MQLTVSNEITDQTFGPVEVHEDMTLEDLVALLELDCNFNSQYHQIQANMLTFDLDQDAQKSLMTLGVKNDDLILIRQKANGNISSTVPELSSDESDYIENFRLVIQNNESIKSHLRTQVADIDTILTDPQLFKQMLGPLLLQKKSLGQSGSSGNMFNISQQEYERLMANPDDPNNKAKLTDLMNQRDIDEQMRIAMEYTPEVFTSVTMLYVDLEINGLPVKAFVDTGAQMTIMSTKLAEKAKLTRLIDKRFQGEARGVGVGKIVGRIHQAQIKIESQFIPCSFVVLDTPMDLLIGLDMLKRYQACVDLEKNVLRIAGVETKFLGEAEIPKDFESSSIVKVEEAANSVNKSQPAQASQNQEPIPLAPKTNENDIKTLQNLGFTREEAIKALKQTNGNVDFAASLLFQ